MAADNLTLETPKLEKKWDLPWPWLLAAALPSLALVLIGNPLFSTLGFEYSALSALALSLTIGLYGAVSTVYTSDIAPASVMVSATYRSIVLGLIPLGISFLSLFFISNCALWDGVLYYLKITLPTAILASRYGATMGWLFPKRKWAVLAFISFWIISLILSLLPGYMNPQLSTYGWQYGYFPGLTWDEYIEFKEGYFWSRTEQLMLAVIMLLIVSYYKDHRKGSLRKVSLVILLPAVSLYAGMLLTHDTTGITSSHGKVEAFLSSRVWIHGKAVIYYRGGSLTPDELDHLRDEVDWAVHDIRNFYKLRERERVAVYVYPNIETMSEYVGTRTASIAKPWLGELHIAKENLGSLKHEIAHVLLREIGSFPFRASWSTGLTEGSAMAIEAGYDGFRTVDEHAARILQLGLARGVKNVMAFTGFASTSSGTAYVLAGSFSKFLIRTHGVDKFKRAYSSLDFDEIYRRPLDSLEADWKASLAGYQTPMTSLDSLRTRYYFDRASMLEQPCLRRVGKLGREAAEAMRREQFAKASRLYTELYEESKNVNAVRGRALAHLKQQDLQGARSLLDSLHISREQQYPALYLLRGDAGDTAFYRMAMELEVSGGNFEAAYVRSMISNKSDFIKSYYRTNTPIRLLALADSEALWIKEYWKAAVFEEAGLYKEAVRSYDTVLALHRDTSDAAERFRQIMTLRVVNLGGMISGATLDRSGWKEELVELQRKKQYLNSRRR